MVILQGEYKNGCLDLYGEAPAQRARVLVIFQDEPKPRQATPDDLALFDKFGGSIKRIVGEKVELTEGLSQKYASIGRC